MFTLAYNVMYSTCIYVYSVRTYVYVHVVVAELIQYIELLSLSSPVYQVEMLCFALICICDSAQPAELPR